MYYFLFGLIVSTTGAIAPGAVNLVVVNYGLKQKNKLASKVIFGATIGEVVLGTFVITFYQMISLINEELVFAKILFLILLTFIGLKLIVQKKKTTHEKPLKINKLDN